MTEEIIIDGVNVSECEYLNTCSNKIRCVILQDDVCVRDNTCKGWKNCYYKQLQRSKQENENLKSCLDIIQKMILSAWEMGKYLDGGLYDDLTNEFAKINEVLQ